MAGDDEELQMLLSSFSGESAVMNDDINNLLFVNNGYNDNYGSPYQVVSNQDQMNIDTVSQFLHIPGTEMKMGFSGIFTLNWVTLETTKL